jgi:hypothetical protein
MSWLILRGRGLSLSWIESFSRCLVRVGWFWFGLVMFGYVWFLVFGLFFMFYVMRDARCLTCYDRMKLVYRTLPGWIGENIMYIALPLSVLFNCCLYTRTGGRHSSKVPVIGMVQITEFTPQR